MSATEKYRDTISLLRKQYWLLPKNELLNNRSYLKFQDLTNNA